MVTVTPRLRAKVDRRKGAFLAAFMAAEQPIAEAATRAVTQAAEEAKTGARATIAAAGFGRKWQNALRADVYPRGRETSIDAAAHIYHRIPYAWVFDEGATIRGNPMLWIPLSHAPQKIGRFRATPERYTRLIGPLQYMRQPGGPPLLAAKIGMTRARAKTEKLPKISLAAAKKGVKGGGKRRVIRSVPMFIGISTVQLRRRFEITRIVRAAATRLGALYFKHLKGD